MILPSKHVKLSGSTLGIGAELLKIINSRQTVTMLWNEARVIPDLGSFEKFTLALDFLYSVSAIEIEEGIIVKRAIE